MELQIGEVAATPDADEPISSLERERRNDLVANRLNKPFSTLVPLFVAAMHPDLERPALGNEASPYARIA